MGLTGDGHLVRVYLDANVFIYFFEERGEVAAAVRRLFAVGRRHPGMFVTSELTLAEILAPSKTGLERPSESYLDLLSGNAIELRAVSRDILLATVQERRATGHKLPDSIHCVTAQAAGCTYFVSRDRAMKRLSAGIMWLDVRDESVNFLIEALGD